MPAIKSKPAHKKPNRKKPASLRPRDLVRRARRKPGAESAAPSAGPASPVSPVSPVAPPDGAAEMVFEIVDGQPRPRLPRSPDGVRFLSVDAAAERFGVARQVLLAEWLNTFSAIETAGLGEISDEATKRRSDEGGGATIQPGLTVGPNPVDANAPESPDGSNSSAIPNSSPRVQVAAAVLAVLRSQKFPKLADEDLEQVLVLAQSRGFDPFCELWADRRFDHFRQEERLIIGPTIDGFRARADRTGKYAGSDEAVFRFEDEESPAHPTHASVTIWKLVDGQRCPFSAGVYWGDYYGWQGGGWQDLMPHVALAKCAEAAALRKAFPRELGNLYLREEMTSLGGEQTRARRPAKNLDASQFAPLPTAARRSTVEPDEDGRTVEPPTDTYAGDRQSPEDLGPVTSRQSFDLALIESFGARPDERRRIYETASTRVRSAPHGQPAWFAQAIADVRANPLAYGLAGHQSAA